MTTPSPFGDKRTTRGFPAIASASTSTEPTKRRRWNTGLMLAEAGVLLAVALGLILAVQAY